MDILLDNIDAFIFDFDGVLTNNLVHLDQDGREWVSCSRADGLAFDVLRRLDKPSFILSTERNPVVSARAEKLKIKALQGIDNKVDALLMLAEINKYNLKNILYMGNDLNDYRVMQLCGFTACPADSHDKIKQISTVVLRTNGGDGVVRELLEQVMKVDIIKIMYTE